MSSEAPYRRIVAELRARIEDGRLAPGDRLPSTRALARRHRVALATATRALRLLIEEGRARALPRIGTVVTALRSPAGELSRDAIVRAGIRIADEEGLEALSMRAVAARVGAAPMSIYRHIANKEELVRAMCEMTVGEHRLPLQVPHGWRAQLEVAARAEWRMLCAHPWVARTLNLTRPQAMLPAVEFANWVMRALDLLGFDGGTKLRLHVLLHTFAQGLALNIEEEARARSESGITESGWMRDEEPKFAALATSGPYPAFAQMLTEVGELDLDLDRLFETGLGVLLDGIEAMSRARRLKHKPASITRRGARSSQRLSSLPTPTLRSR
jgi:AcrR family transcriptional regulator